MAERMTGTQEARINTHIRFLLTIVVSSAVLSLMQPSVSAVETKLSWCELECEQIFASKAPKKPRCKSKKVVRGGKVRSVKANPKACTQKNQTYSDKQATHATAMSLQNLLEDRATCVSGCSDSLKTANLQKAATDPIVGVKDFALTAVKLNGCMRQQVCITPEICWTDTKRCIRNCPTVESMTKIVRAHLNHTRYCIDRETPGNPSLKRATSSVAVDFTEAGRVAKAWIVESTIDAKSKENVERCIVHRHRRFRFPKAGVGGCSILIPYTYKAVKTKRFGKLRVGTIKAHP